MTGERLLLTSSEIKSYQRELTLGAWRQHASCAEARVSSWFDGKLYRRGARSGVLMKCVTKEDGYDILREIHEGVCGNHVTSRTLVGKAHRASFWWPTAVTDAEDLVRRSQNC
jgi:hypothetical protein